MFEGAIHICFSNLVRRRACSARQTECGGYKIHWNLKKSWILSKIVTSEGYLWASRRAPMPWRALKLSGMKRWMNLEGFRTLNQPLISKIHEDNSDWNLITTARARTVLELENTNKILIKSTSNLISAFEAFELFQVTLEQRVLKLNLRSIVRNASTFQKLCPGGHVVRARPNAEAMESGEIWENLGFWAKSWFLKGVYELLGARLCLGVHWNCQEWKAGWI